jgi:hypothetical protein
MSSSAGGIGTTMTSTSSRIAAGRAMVRPPENILPIV